MEIRFFGRLGERIGREIEIEPPPPGCTVGELRVLLAALYPDAAEELASMSTRACIDDTIVGEEAAVDPARAVEFFPPVSGG